MREGQPERVHRVGVGTLRRVQQALLDWYSANRRGLAWRRTTDPYRILVSEVMLQQTQASRVEPAFTAFLEQFPTVHDLAGAPRADVLRAWRGLGYNRRAVALHQAAQEIVAEHDAEVPADLDALRSLPGVGDYTARAVLAFAFGADAGPVDTNVARVLTRAVAGRPLPRRELQALADDLVPAGRGADWSAALMDLGATHCLGRAPRCSGCPVVGHCTWRCAGAEDPWTAAKPGPQSTFAGSDRYHRGRLLDALRRGSVDATRLPVAAQLPEDPDRAARIGEGLVRDGLAVWSQRTLRLPA
jgi:A/G-specific adenine glycosylase